MNVKQNTYFKDTLSSLFTLIDNMYWYYIEIYKDLYIKCCLIFDRH